MTGSPQPAGRPNVVLILVDDMGFSDLGVTGSEIATPHIDSLAAGGAILTAMYNCGRCCPTRASLLTGLYPHRAGVGHMTAQLSLPGYQGCLAADSATIAEVLRPAGYRTLMAGKWHVGGDFQPREADGWRIGDIDHPTPLQRGFDRFFGILHGAGSYFDPHHLMEDDRRVFAGDGFYMTDAVTDHAIAMIGEGDPARPFFLYLSYTAPHWPLQAPAEDIARYRGVYRDGWDAARLARHERLTARRIFRRPWALSPRDPAAMAWRDAPDKDWEALRMAVYAAMVDRMDQGVGRLLAHLDARGLTDDTVILFLSDNGGCAKEGLGEGFPDRLPDGRPVTIGNRPDVTPGGRQSFMTYGRCWSNLSNVPFRLHKSWVHEGGISTPLIARWPGRIAPGRALDDPCHVMDILPTILEATGAAMPTEMGGHALKALDGVSLMGGLASGELPRGERPGGRAIFWEHGGHAAARIGPLKLVRERGEAWALHDMDADRTELADLAPTHPADVDAMVEAYRRWARWCGVKPWPQVVRRFGAAREGAEN